MPVPTARPIAARPNPPHTSGEIAVVGARDEDVLAGIQALGAAEVCVTDHVSVDQHGHLVERATRDVEERLRNPPCEIGGVLPCERAFVETRTAATPSRRPFMAAKLPEPVPGT